MSNPDKAAELFQSCNCAQAVLGTLGPAAGLPADACFRVGAAFGGGMARMGLTCGAVTGGMMVLGVRHGDSSIQAFHEQGMHQGICTQLVRSAVEILDAMETA